MTSEDLYKIFIEYPIICTDSRETKPDSIFFALKGDNFDGNQYAYEALENGCAFAVVDNKEFIKDQRCILVDNAVIALQEIARLHRINNSIPIIAITGSNGKTTTKELCSNVLRQKFNIVSTEGNLNNHIGVPLTILRINEITEIAVVEIGANHRGEIEILCDIAKPDYGLITNIGKAHLEGFGSFEGVIKAKRELFEYIMKTEGRIFINGDDSLLMDLGSGLESMSYGITSNNDVKGEIIKADPFISIKWQKGRDKNGKQYMIDTRLIGKYNMYNVLAAVTIGLYFNIDPETISRSISGYTPRNNRSQYTLTKTNVLLLDAYNANPSSMESALNNFEEIEAVHKTIIIGDMLELGDESHIEHDNILRLIKEKHFNNVILVGEMFSHANIESSFQSFENISQLRDYLQLNPISGSTILLKASRMIGLENLIDLL